MGQVFEGAFGVLIFVAGIILLLAQIAAAASGLEVLWGWNGLLASVAVAAGVIFLGPIGSVAAAILGFFGATMDWGWDWWQAVLLVAPGLVFSVLASLGGGLFALVGSVFGRRG